MSSSEIDVGISSHRVVTPNGVSPATILINDGRILDVTERGWRGQARHWRDMGDLVVSPGSVDIHVHCNEPGRTAWEGFGCATRAAAAGGVTTILDMPLNSVPPTTDPSALQDKQAAARGAIHIDVGFWGGIIPGSLDQLDALADAGAFGAKCFLTHSGVEEFPAVSDAELTAALEVLGGHDLPVLVHAEDEPTLQAATFAGDARSYPAWAASRPATAESRAIERVVAAARATGGWAHIVHVSSAEGVAAVRRARDDGVRITAETCPHYLALAAEDLPQGAVTAKCAPPIRSAEHRRALWAALAAETLDAVASDHSPCPVELKDPSSGDLARAWGGISSLQLWPRVLWTQAAARGWGLDDLAAWTATRPAQLAKMARKGALVPGCDGDLVVWDPDETVTVNVADLESRHPQTPYAGHRLRGRIHATYLRGDLVWAEGMVVGDPRGDMLDPGRA